MFTTVLASACCLPSGISFSSNRAIKGRNPIIKTTPSTLNKSFCVCYLGARHYLGRLLLKKPTLANLANCAASSTPILAVVRLTFDFFANSANDIVRSP